MFWSFPDPMWVEFFNYYFWDLFWCFLCVGVLMEFGKILCDNWNKKMSLFRWTPLNLRKVINLQGFVVFAAVVRFLFRLEYWLEIVRSWNVLYIWWKVRENLVKLRFESWSKLISHNILGLFFFVILLFSTQYFLTLNQQKAQRFPLRFTSKKIFKLMFVLCQSVAYEKLKC